MAGYVTLEEANEIVDNLYVSTSTEYTTWASLSDSDKQALLNRAFYRIESLPFTGYPTKNPPDQTTAFPRNGDTEIPEQIKLAQVTESLTGDQMRADNQKYAMMSARGIISFRFYNL